MHMYTQTYALHSKDIYKIQIYTHNYVDSKTDTMIYISLSLIVNIHT